MVQRRIVNGENLKIKVARVCLVTSILLFVFGTMMLCDCVGMFVLSGLFSLVTIKTGTKRVRVAGVVVLLFSLAVAVLMIRTR
jgi:hypothetical protein